MLAEQSPHDKTSLFEILRDVAEHDPKRGMIVLLSDLFTEREGLFKGLKLLRQRGHDLLVLHVLADDELDFTFTGPTRFEGLETADMLNCNPRAPRRLSRSARKLPPRNPPRLRSERGRLSAGENERTAGCCAGGATGQPSESAATVVSEE